MELGILLIAALSAAVGLALRRWVSLRLAKILLVFGGGLSALAIGVIAIVAFSQGRIIGVWTGGMLAVVFLGVGALVLPFAVAVSWGRFGR